MDKEQSLELARFLRDQLKEVDSFMDYFRENLAKYADKRIKIERLLEWAEEEALKEIKKDEV